MDKASSRTESTGKLREAICKLEAYSLQQMESLKTSSVSKTISLMRSILVSHFEHHQKKHRHQRHPPNTNEVLTAVEWINRNRLFIEKLKEGTPAEQELAEKFTQTINTYNDNCDKRIQVCVSGRQRLANFFLKVKQQDEQELPKIALLKNVTIQRHYPEHLSPKKIRNFTVGSEVAVPISKQSAELFHMKAIALVEHISEMVLETEARAFVKKSPIHTAVEEHTSICTLTQTFSLFPGQTIVVMGNSALNPKTQAISQLFPDTFYLLLEHTGFPHPIQRAGWTVASQLLPEFPQRIDLLNETADLFQRKNQAVVGLLQQGNLLKHAKELLSLKKKCFAEHAKELIDLQKTLNLTILTAVSADSAAHEVVGRFFDSLHIHPNPFEALADASQIMREYFMVKPHQMLLDAIIKGKSTNLGNPIPEARYLAAKDLLDQAVDIAKKDIRRQNDEAKLLNEHIKLDYIECIGSILGEASKQIFLQYLSEDLIFKPPSLTSFECKVQTAAYRHLKDFLDELTISLEGGKTRNQELAYHLLKDQISSDIALFQEEAPLAISKELANYFQTRYLSLSSLS